MTTIFKIDSKDKVRLVNFFTQGEVLNMESGVLDGKLVTNTKVCKGKNIGKANETSPEDQALAEMQSRITKKLDEGYFYSIEEARKTEVIKPMLAKPYEDRVHKIDWTQLVCVQPKLDGMRCLAIIKDDTVKLQSRDGKDIMVTGGGSMQHIIDDIKKNIKTDCILDGELYAHGLSFQENMKLIKKKRTNSTSINYNVYDVVDDASYGERYVEFLGSCGSYNLQKYSETEYIKLIETHRVDNETDLRLAHANYISQGYEGSIIRHGNAGYEMKRSDSLLKRKDFFDIKAVIVDVLPGEQKSEWGVPLLECIKTENGVEAGTRFSSGMRMTHEEKKDLLINKKNYVGKICEIRFFETTDDGLPRFPVLTGFID